MSPDVLFVALGGDGTMIHALKQTAIHNNSVIGINMGRLGFLTDYSYTDEDVIRFYNDLVDILYNKVETVIEERMIICNSFAGDYHPEYIALNEFYIAESETGKMLDFKIHIDGNSIGPIRGDGILDKLFYHPHEQLHLNL